MLSASMGVINIASATAAGCYSMYLFYLLLFKQKSWGFTYLQSYIALIYVMLLAALITSVELRVLRHPHVIFLTYFLMFPQGKGFSFVFMGAILLGALIWGWFLGGVLVAVGVLNITARFCGDTGLDRTGTVELQ